MQDDDRNEDCQTFHVLHAGTCDDCGHSDATVVGLPALGLPEFNRYGGPVIALCSRCVRKNRVRVRTGCDLDLS